MNSHLSHTYALPHAASLKQHKMICEEKQGLLEAYQAATQRYSVAVTDLVHKFSSLSKKDYDLLYKGTETLLQDVAAARFKLQSHVLEHRC